MKFHFCMANPAISPKGMIHVTQSCNIEHDLRGRTLNKCWYLRVTEANWTARNKCSHNTIKTKELSTYIWITSVGASWLLKFCIVCYAIFLTTEITESYRVKLLLSQVEIYHIYSIKNTALLLWNQENLVLKKEDKNRWHA